MGNVSRKAFRIVELDGRKCRWVAEQDFHGNFWVSCTCSFAFPFFLFDVHELLDVVVINTDHDDVTSDTRDMGPHGWIRVVQWRVGEYNNKLRCFRLQAHASFVRATHGKRKSRLL